MVRGLDDVDAEDNAAAGGARTRLPTGGMAALERRDLAVRTVASAVTLAHQNGRTLTLERDNFADVVVWHPAAMPQ